MTRSAAPVSTFPGSQILAQFARSLISLAKAFKDRREVKNLAEFDERMLKDIGLTRSDVVSALAEPIHHHPSWVLVRCVGRPAEVLRSTAARKPRPVVPLVSRV
ncbi:hypothetical protein AA309_21260 [Microvirga vignae]|uniref:YjiS-like domain-containing protein n=1 Tax=Microvirga vignae TaxID=1225564 RepID=A0A0H1RF22_9HYPH|nr:DUF1127 domain-containing protein [Microvirga vignae]KLK91207.1 hypothetical protein AA309_21260 [Microvirga vignae]